MFINYYSKVIRNNENWKTLLAELNITSEDKEEEVAKKIATAMVFEIISLGIKSKVGSGEEKENRQLLWNYDLAIKLSNALVDGDMDAGILAVFNQRDNKLMNTSTSSNEFSKLVSNIVYGDIKIEEVHQKVAEAIYKFSTNYGLLAKSDEIILESLITEIKKVDEKIENERDRIEIKSAIAAAIAEHINQNHKYAFYSRSEKPESYLIEALNFCEPLLSKEDIKIYKELLKAKNRTLNPVYQNKSEVLVQDKGNKPEASVEDKEKKPGDLVQVMNPVFNKKMKFVTPLFRKEDNKGQVDQPLMFFPIKRKIRDIKVKKK